MNDDANTDHYSEQVNLENYFFCFVFEEENKKVIKVVNDVKNWDHNTVKLDKF